MKLKIVSRKGNSKSEVKQLRRSGSIPAVLYVKGKSGETIALSSTEFGAHLRAVKPGHLPTTIFTLVDEKGKERRVLVKDIQYEITTYAVIHLDFEELVDADLINVKVPIECTGSGESAGIKLGGVLRQVLRHVQVRCRGDRLPPFFELDIKELELGQSKRLSDLQIPEDVRSLVNLNEVVAAIVKR